MNWRAWPKNVRFWVLVFSVFVALAIYMWVQLVVPAGGSLRVIRLTEAYALTALTYLYVTLLIGPAVYTFTWLPWRGQIYRARRAVGFSAWGFAVIHAYLAFFSLLGGFAGLAFLNNTYLLATSLSTAALIILTLLPATSFDAMRRWLGPWWKWLHRLAYVAGVLILIHALMLGSQFTSITGLVPQLVAVALGFLGLLEADRVDAWLQRRWRWQARFGPGFLLVVAVIAVYVTVSFAPADVLPGLNVHAQHIQLAQQTQAGALPGGVNVLAGLLGTGDPTKRYTVSFAHPDEVRAGVPVTLTFTAYDANTGSAVAIFLPVYSQLMHLVIVDSSLNYFSHIHPTQSERGFTITTTFPHDGVYHLYVNFQPLGAIEQQIGMSLSVGQGNQGTQPEPNFDESTSIVVGKYKVWLQAPQPLVASELSVGKQTLRFVVTDAATGAPVTNLQPYLAAFGHLVLINTTTFDYLHVHPATLIAPPAGATSGPNVDFVPLGLWGPIKPGTYKAFAQFNPGGQLITAEFMVKIH